jgi:kynureninase
MNRSDCEQLDLNDPLSSLRHHFALPENMIYLDGNSLGARPHAALSRAQEVISQEWGNDLIKSWNKAAWFDMPLRLGNLLAPLIGARADEVVVTDSTSINLFKAIAAALQIQAQDLAHSKRRVIVSERSNFPTDLYMAQGICQWLDRGYSLHMVDSHEELLSAINEKTALVLLTHVNYRSGYVHDMQALTRHSHEQGALIIWDLAHSAGAVEVNLHEAQADFAVGCCYKYLNGGPGAPAFIWVPKHHQSQFTHPLSGWWGHAQPFAMNPQFEPASGIRRAMCGTQAMISLALVEPGLAIFAQTSMTALRKKSLALTDLFISLIQQKAAHLQLELITPIAHEERGSQVSYRHPHAYAVMQALIEQNVIGDYREPSIIRFGFTPLYTRFVDVYDAVDVLIDILTKQNYSVNSQRNTVT